MRTTFSLLLFALFTTTAWAQPFNDDCDSAEQLNLSQAPSCPSTTTVTDNFSFSNVDATPVTPFPLFNCADGSNSGPAAEVWFTFVATANQTTITVSGLTTPSIVLYRGNSCISLQGINCNSSNGSTTITTNTLVGQTYYILVSGGDPDDQGTFNLEFESGNLCNSCAPPGAISLDINPPPINGTFTSGSTVQVCATINEWESNAAGTVEWLHAVTFEFGPGWNPVSAADATPPSPLHGSGSWGWYDSWTGCDSGNTFGPGFAFDSDVGVGCGGTANDGDPGNNWGDGDPFGTGDITPANPITFCVDVTVSDCPPIATGEDLGIDVNIYSDGDSGNWTQTGCNTGQSIDITSSAICCNDLEPLVSTTPISCFGANDGSFDIQGNGGIDPTEVFNIYVLDGSGTPVFECLGCNGIVTTGPVLGPDNYSVVAINVATDCPVSTSVNLSEPAQPTVTPMQTNMPCPGDAAMLTAITNPAGSVVTYTWTGPGGPYSGQSPSVTQAGTYTVVAIVDGCESAPADIDVTFVDFTTEIIAAETAVCEGESLSFLSLGGVSFSWENVTTGENIGNNSFLTYTFTQPTTIRLTATDANGCTATDEVDITINPLPSITISQIGSGCENENIQLIANGADTYVWSDGASSNPYTVVGLTPGVYTYSVTGTDGNGCENTASYDLEILPAPTGTLDVDPNPVCSGQPTSLTLNVSGISSIFWYDGIGPANQNPITINPISSQAVTADVTNGFGCINTFLASVDVEQPPPSTNVICGLTTPNSVEFVWDPVPGADNYEISINGAPPFTVTGTTYTATGLNPGQNVTIVVQPLGANLCPPPSSTATCMTEACPPITLNIDAVADICLEDVNVPFNLTYSSSNNSGTFSWSGPGIIDANLGTFDPGNAGVGAHEITLTYDEPPCTYTAMTTINIFETPEASFTIVPDPVCVGESVDITFTGMAGGAATYTWDFDGGNATPGNGQGPHQVNWDSPGSKNVSLTVTENGCTSEAFSATVEVTSPLNPPMISCSNQTTSSVTFTWPVDPSAGSYDIDVPTGQVGVSGNGTITFDGLMPNELVTIEVTANTSNPCGSVSAFADCSTLDCPDFTINISAIPDICLTGSTSPLTLTATATGGDGSGNITWSGTNVTGDQFDPEMAGAGMHDITATYTEGNCSESATVTVNVFATPTADFSVSPATVCIGEDATVTYAGSASTAADFVWTFNGGTATTGTGMGPHTVNWATGGIKTISLTVTENGCTSTTFTQEVTVATPLAAPVINCAPTPNSIVFSWNAVSGASDYLVSIVSGPAGASGTLDINALTYTVTGLMANDAVEVEVIAVGPPPCGNSMATQSCIAEDCPMVTVDIDLVDPICLDGTATDIDLEATVTGGLGGGTLTWSGPSITDPANGIFDPVGAGAGTWTITASYQEGNCPYNASIDIQVNAQPSADFTMDAVICQTDTATVTYTGSAGAGATYNWNFGEGAASPGTGQGPHLVSWPNSGPQSVALTVIENDCSSIEFTQDINVQAPLAAPDISCEPTTSSIIFSWPPITDATGYTVNVVTGPNGVYDNVNLTYTIDMLSSGDEVEIEVTAIGNGPCGNSMSSLSCIADPCPAVTIDLTAVDPICLDAAATTVDVEAVVTGGPGTGILSWSGTGITDPVAGIFDPAVAGPGIWTVTATYEEGNCTYDNAIDIIVNAQPSADFTVDDTICQSDAATVTYTGSAAADATYSWDFGGGDATPGNGQGPHTVSWPSSGTPTISLTVTENDCASEPFTADVNVEAPQAEPVITCVTTTSSIVFSWEDIAGASDYTVNLISGPTGVYDDVNFTYTVNNLDPGEAVEIEVVANSSNACPSSSTLQNCQADDCPMVNVTIDAVAPVCLNAASADFDLAATTVGGQGGGDLSWSGTGITNATAGTFSPGNSGAGDFDITATYTEDNCTYTATIPIQVFAEPTADFSLSSDLICVGDTITVTYTGTATAGATYNWNFDGGSADPMTGPGPHLVSWNSSGMPVISLTVTENGCTSPEVNNALTVAEPLAAPAINCSPDYTSIVFSWEAVTGADSYTVEDLVLPAGATTVLDETALTYTVSDLNPGDAVTIRVNALSNGPCADSSAEFSCSATPCDNISFAPITYGPFCANDELQVLTGMVNSAMGTGTFSWGGPIVDPATGEFDPALAGAGSYDLMLFYTENSCLFDTTYTIEVLPVPTADFTVDPLICVNETATLTYTGMASANVIYNWDVGTANITGDDPGPYTLSWTEPGTYTLSLFVEDNGCVSPEFSQTIVVDAIIPPVEIVCQETSATTVLFAWEDVPGADSYTVNVLQGNVGTQVGNTYLMEGLSPDDVVEIEVIADGPSSCGPSTATGSCIAEACQPLTLSLDGPTELCAGEDAQITFNITTNQDGPFAVTYSLNGDESTATVADGESITLSSLSETTDIAIVEIIDTALPECIYLSDATWSIQVDQVVNAGTANNPDALCQDTPSTFDLNNLLTDADAGGIWTETSAVPSTGGAFNAATGTFNTANQTPGIYTFLYTLEGGACPDASSTVAVEVLPTPVADAGPEQFLSCTMGATTLGGNSSSGAGITYLWTVDNPDAVITDPTQAMIDASSPGTYTLTVSNEFGCSSTDQVTVSADFEVPVADVSISEISCFSANDGAIVINNVSGGVPPYTFVLNGGAPTTNTFFNNLGAAEYSLLIQDANGCFTELFIDMDEPEEVIVELITSLENNDNTISLGESITLEAVFNPNLNIESITWKPDSIAAPNATSVQVSPLETTSYTVTIADENGCNDSDNLTVIVEKLRPVYVPTAFSPDDDGTNDIFYVQGGSDIQEVKSFYVFNRWGESVFENTNFQPNDPTQGWNGRHRGQALNAAVFVYFLEVEFTDGEVILYKGDVILLK